MNELNGFIKNQLLRIFNTQKKKEISEKYGASFASGGEGSLPPETEAEWLANIEEFERQFENAREIPLLEYIGSPAIRKIDDIPVRELKREYDRLESALSENGIYIEFPDRLGLKEKYRFISEELIVELVDDIRMPGLVLHFMYEEFHPGEDLN